MRRVLRIKLRAGIFERPYADADHEKRTLLTPESRAAARDIAARSMVLLQERRRCSLSTACAGSPSSVRWPTIGRT